MRCNIKYLWRAEEKRALQLRQKPWFFTPLVWGFFSIFYELLKLFYVVIYSENSINSILAYFWSGMQAYHCWKPSLHSLLCLHTKTDSKHSFMQRLQGIPLLLLMHILCFTLQLKAWDGKNYTQFCITTGFSTSFQFPYLSNLRKSSKDNNECRMSRQFLVKKLAIITPMVGFHSYSLLSIIVGCLVHPGRGEEKEVKAMVKFALINRSLKLGCGGVWFWSTLWWF